MSCKLRRLYNLRFEKAGDWRLNNGALTRKLNSHNRMRHIVYAFVLTTNDVVYIGSSTQTLQKRMQGYRKPGRTQSTNIKNKGKITHCIKQRLPVRIFVFADRENIKYKGIRVNLAAGLEDPLIAKLKPPWNKRGK